MNISFVSLNYSFVKKPLLIGGKAMEYYGLRSAGNDIDFVASFEDIKALIEKYPTYLKDLAGDLGITVHGLEIWRTICYFNYDFLSIGAEEEENILIISLEKLLFLKTLRLDNPKDSNDRTLLVKKILGTQEKKYKEVKQVNEDIVKNISSISYIERKAPFS